MTVYDYPDGTLALRQDYCSPDWQIFENCFYYSWISR